MNRKVLFLLPLLFLGCGNGEENTLRFTGIMDANTVRVSAESSGRVIGLHFDEGVQVDSGATLITVESERLGYQLSAQQSGADEVLYNYAAADKELDAARLQRDNLAQKYQRLTALLQSKAVTQQAVDDLKAQLDVADRKLEGAKKQISALLSRRQQMTSNMKATKDQMDKSAVSAPLKGTVLVRYVERGELVMPGSPVCEIADLNGMWTKIYVSEKQLPSLQVNQKVTVHIDGQQQTLEGWISWISSESEFTPKTILTEETRTALVYAAKVRVPNPDGVLKIGMPVSVTVDTSY